MQTFSQYSDITNLEEIKNDLLKPVHQYAQKICPKPVIENNIIIQKVYAESLISFISDEEINLISRTAIQQYRKSELDNIPIPDNCFSPMYEFYVTWFPDIDQLVKIKNYPDSPFYLPNEIVINFQKIYPEPRIDLPKIWVPFFIKKESHAIKKDYGKILLSDIAYIMEIL